MRRLAALLRRERGASAVIVAILAIPLIGFSAIAVDVGAIYYERAELQHGADGAALAVASACAKSESTCPGQASSLASEFASGNALDAIEGASFPSGGPNTATNEVVVLTSTITANGDTAIQHPLAAVIGVDSTTVTASATAEWGTPVAGTTIPLAIGYCEFQLHQPQDGVANPTRILIQYNTTTRRECTDVNMPGGFGWLDGSGCSSEVDVADPWMGSDTGNSVPAGCTSVLPGLIGTTVLIPIYDQILGTGNNGQFHIATFAAFFISGYKFSGGNSTTDPLAPACNGSCRGIQGYFLKYVDVGDAFELGDGPNAGLQVVRLIN